MGRIVIGTLEARSDATPEERENIDAANTWARQGIAPPVAITPHKNATDAERANIQAANEWAQASVRPEAVTSPLPEGQGVKVAKVAIPVAIGAGAGFLVAKQIKQSAAVGAAIGAGLGFLITRFKMP